MTLPRSFPCGEPCSCTIRCALDDLLLTHGDGYVCSVCAGPVPRLTDHEHPETGNPVHPGCCPVCVPHLTPPAADRDWPTLLESRAAGYGPHGAPPTLLGHGPRSQAQMARDERAGP